MTAVMTAMSLAETAMRAAIRRRLVRRVVIKDDKAWEALYAQLQKALTQAWTEAMREGIAQALDRLRDLGPGAFTAEDGATLLRVLEASVGPDALRAAMREPVINLTDALYRLGAAEVGTSAGVDIAFMRPDLDALDALKRGNLFWVGESWNTHSRKKLDAILTEYFTTGLTREGLAARIAGDFATVTGKSELYWEMLADHIATKGREIGRVTGYERAGITRVQVRAHLDDRTTQICRDMHGRVIEVSALRKQADGYIEAANRGDKPAIERIWTMHGANADLSQVPTSALKGTASPPYHYRCRTITVAWFGATTEMGRLEQAITDREEISADQVAFIREVAGKAAWMDEKNERRHWGDHGSDLPVRKMADFETSARAVIADPKARIRLSMRTPKPDRDAGSHETRPYAVFAVPHAVAPKGGGKRPAVAGHLMTSVRLDTGEIVTHFWKNGDLTSIYDVVPARDVLKAAFRRVIRWLFG